LRKGLRPTSEMRNCGRLRKLRNGELILDSNENRRFKCHEAVDAQARVDPLAARTAPRDAVGSSRPSSRKSPKCSNGLGRAASPAASPPPLTNSSRAPTRKTASGQSESGCPTASAYPPSGPNPRRRTSAHSSRKPRKEWPSTRAISSTGPTPKRFGESPRASRLLRRLTWAARATSGRARRWSG
jgi:hypothetical protein